MANQPAEKLFNVLGLNVSGDLGPLTFYTSKRHKLTWFLKAPPTAPPTDWQIRQRNNFRLAAELWSRSDQAFRDEWNKAARGASLCMTGYNLWVHHILIGDEKVLETIQRQTHTHLIPH